MKLDFWLELHKSLLNLIQDEITKEEMTIFNHIESTINVRYFLFLRNLMKYYHLKIFETLITCPNFPKTKWKLLNRKFSVSIKRKLS